MRQFLVFTCAAFLTTVCAGEENHVAGALLGKQVYWQKEGMKLDTVGWAQINGALSDKTDGESTVLGNAANALDLSGMKLMKLKNLTAISTAILSDLGYTVVILSQWVLEPSGFINLNDEYNSQHKKQRIVSDYLWESVAHTSVSRGTVVNKDFKMQIHFQDGGFSLYAGNDLVEREFPVIQSNDKEFHLTFTGRETVNANGRRKVYSAWLVCRKELKGSQIVKQVEKEMDALRLDLTYPSPEIVESKLTR